MARPDWMMGKVVKDATRPVTINIRQHHIDEAVGLKGDQCVAARCTLQALDASHVWFYRSKAYVEWDDSGVILRYQNSDSLIRKVIQILDDPKRKNSEIQPGLYNLNPPPPTQALGVDRQPKPGRQKRKPHTVHKSHRITGRITAAKSA
jgi:hypothetical protein